MRARQARAILHVVLLAIALAAGAVTRPAFAVSTADFLASLSDSEIDQFQAWRSARRGYEQQLDDYWEQVEAKRIARKPKRAAKIAFTSADYVMSYPPTYTGPKLAADLARKYEKFVDEQDKSQPAPPQDFATVADYLEAAKRVYNFTPERLSEKEFKRRYAEEAAALGLSKDQVVRVYALETGGIGTYDMQSGIHPIKKTGRPISSALGYAQLLDANSVNELALSGDKFIARLSHKARNPNLATAQAAAIRAKVVALKKMYANVKRVPFEWTAHQAYAKTPEGMGVHAINIDGDIGPMLQAIKLRGLMDTAAKAGRMQLSGAEMEIMNLSGPVTGLEMMQPAGEKAPTTNFFARRAYYVNKMVIGLTGAQLLAELDRRMDADIKSAGSVEFAAAFDSVAGQTGTGR